MLTKVLINWQILKMQLSQSTGRVYISLGVGLKDIHELYTIFIVPFDKEYIKTKYYKKYQT